MSDWNERSDNTGIVIAILIVVVLLGAGGVLFTYRQAAVAEESRMRAILDEREARIEAERARELAEREADKSAALSEFIAKMIRDADPAEDGAPNITLRDALEAAEREAAKPEIDEDLRKALELVIKRARADLDEKK